MTYPRLQYVDQSQNDRCSQIAQTWAQRTLTEGEATADGAFAHGLPITGQRIALTSDGIGTKADAAGAVTFDGMFHIKKGHGLVNQVFEPKHIERLHGTSGLGHIRHATLGTTDTLDGQPIYVNYPSGVAMVHNENVVNFLHVRDTLYRDHHRLVDTSNDIALLLYTFAAHLETCDLEHLTIEDLFACVRATQRNVHARMRPSRLPPTADFLRSPIRTASPRSPSASVATTTSPRHPNPRAWTTLDTNTSEISAPAKPCSLTGRCGSIATRESKRPARSVCSSTSTSHARTRSSISDSSPTSGCVWGMLLRMRYAIPGLLPT